MKTIFKPIILVNHYNFVLKLCKNINAIILITPKSAIKIPTHSHKPGEIKINETTYSKSQSFNWIRLIAVSIKFIPRISFKTIFERRNVLNPRNPTY